MEMKELVLSKQMVALVITFLCGVLYPFWCTVRLWNEEKRLVLFGMAKWIYKSEFEKRCWESCASAYKIAMSLMLIFLIGMFVDNFCEG